MNVWIEMAVRIVVAAVLGGVLLYGAMHLLGWPGRMIRKWEDQMLLREITEAEQYYADDGHPASAGYVMGLRTAGVFLGAIQPDSRQDRALRRCKR